MRFSDMPADELIVRSLPLAFMVLSGVFCACSALAGRSRRRRGLAAPGVYPGSREQAGDLNLGWWRSLSTVEQEAADTAALDEAQDVEVAAADAAWAAERAAQAVVEQAARTNVLYHP